MAVLYFPLQLPLLFLQLPEKKDYTSFYNFNIVRNIFLNNGAQDTRLIHAKKTILALPEDETGSAERDDKY